MRVAEAGVPFREDEMSVWEQQIATYYDSRSREQQAEGKVTVKQAKAEAAQPRLASCDILLAIENALCQHFGKHIMDFGPASETGNVLMLSGFDECGTNACPFYFLRHKLKLRTEMIFDNYHRRSNDINLAVDCAGYRTVVTKGHVKNNLAYGPWNGGGYAQMLLDGSLDMAASMKESDPLLMEHWPGIVEDRQITDEEGMGSVAREAFLQRLPANRNTTTKPPRSAPSRFFSWNHACNFSDKDWVEQLLKMTYVCIRKRWKTTKEHVPRKRGKATLVGPAVLANGPAASSSSSSSAATAAVAAAPAVAAKAATKPSTKSAVAKAKDKIAQDRARTTNTFVCVQEWMQDVSFKQELRWVLDVTNVVADEHHDITTTMVGVQATVKQFCSWATGSWISVLCKVLAVSKDELALRRAGFVFRVPDMDKLTETDPIVLDQDSLSFKSLRLVHLVLKYRATSCMWHVWGWPGPSAMLASESTDMVRAGLAHLARCHYAVEWCRAQGGKCTELAEKCFLNNGVMKPLVTELVKVEFRELTSEAKKLVRAMWHGMGQSLVCEKANKELRDSETRDNSSKALSRIRRWEQLVNKDLVGAFGHTPLATSAALPVPSRESFDHMFRHSSQVTELTAPLHTIMKEKDWESYSPHSIRRLYGEMALMVQAYERKSAELVTESWRTWFLPEFTMVVERSPESTEGHFVLCNLGSAVVTWPCRRIGHAIVLEENPAKVKELKFKSTSSFNNVYVLPCAACSPLHARLLKMP